ncbi:MAG: outer membrane beta-barrel protein [Anderseniella sp.]|jgi:hypothetical protein|nr:outer membrane beta-barrel protein [Anderseniella sp.]
MRGIFASASMAAIVLCVPALAVAQEASGLRQTVIIEDPFADARVPVSPPAFMERPAVRDAGAGQRRADEAAGIGVNSAETTTQSSRSVFDQGADLDVSDESVLAYSGYDSINREAEDRRRLWLLAATGQLPPAEDEQLVRRAAAGADPYAPLGIRRGAFILFPELEVGSVYSSNVTSSATNARDDFGLRLAPRIALRSDWERHALAFEGQGELVFWDEFNEQNVNNGSVAASGRLDIRSTTTLDLSAGLGWSQATATDFEVPNTAIGPRNDTAYNMLARLTHVMGRIVTQTTAAATWFKFGDLDLGALGEELNDDRDYVAPAVGLRVGYQMSEAVQPFVEVTYSPRLHDQNVDRNGLRRDSQGVVIRSGITFNDGSIWSGEVAARYEFRDYEDATLRSQSALGMDANVSWAPTALTTVQFTAASQIEESSDPLVSGATNWTAGVLVSHQMLDNVALEAGASMGYTDYDDISSETGFGATLGAAYAIHRDVELTAGYEFSLTKPDAGNSTSEHRVSSGLRFRL